MNKGIAIIGGGNLGIAIAEGLINKKYTDPASITVTRRNISKLDGLKDKGVRVTADNIEAVRERDIVILAVKPYQIRDILVQISGSLHAGKLVISVITGVTLSDMEEIVPGDVPLFRAMPNTAIAIGESMTCICSNTAGGPYNDIVTGLFEQLGKTVNINENLMEAATVLGACGIAYALRFIRANIQGGIEIGFDSATASLIAAQTAKGAAQLLIERGMHPEEEIDKVTTPKGCTIAGLNEMEHRGFSSSLIKGISASYKKIEK